MKKLIGIAILASVLLLPAGSWADTKISAFSTKASPIAADLFLLLDSANSNANAKGTLGTLGLPVLGNAYTQFTGPTTAAKTFTLPDANATMVYQHIASAILGTASSAAGSLVFQDASNANTFTIQPGTTGANISWTLPTAVPGGNGYLVTASTGGVLTYTDPSTLGGGGVPTTITAANEATDTTCFPTFFTAATGDLGPKTNSGLTFNSNTGMLTATGLTGPLTGAASSNILTTAKAAASGVASLDGSSKVVQDPANATATPTASKIPIADGSGKLDGWITPGATITAANEASDSTCFPLFVTAATGSLGPKTNANLTYDASTGTFGIGTMTLTTDGKIKLSGTTKIDLSVAAGDLAVGTGLSISSGSGTAALSNGGATVSVATGYAIPNLVAFTGPSSTTKTFTLPNADSTLATLAGAETLTNKRITKRVKVLPYNDATVTVGETSDYNTDLADIFYCGTPASSHGLAQGTNFGPPGGTPTAGQQIEFLIYFAAQHDLTWDTVFVSRGATLPTTGAGGTAKYLRVLFQWNDLASKWDCIATAPEA